MKIHSLYYKNLLQGWELEEVHFSDLNVLVGISGAGKTQTINAIASLAEMTKDEVEMKIDWGISFSIGNDMYIWKGNSDYYGKDEYDNAPEEWVNEKLILNGLEIASQQNGKIKYNGQMLPKLGYRESLLKLLSEPNIEKARKGFQSIIHKDYRNYQEETISYDSIHKLLPHYNHLSDIKNSKLPLLAKWYIVTNKFPELHEQIQKDYKDIFSQVKEIALWTVDTNRMIDICLYMNNGSVVIQSEISSGMFRTLMAMVELYLCHEESLFLLDEFENSLGFNCLDKMFELIENKAYSGENQFILTTHNPYIIRNTDLSAIKIVTRKGNKIIIKNAIDMGLAESAQDNFFKIINLKEFREGVSA